MAAADHLERQAPDQFHRIGYQFPVGHQDVGEVFLGFEEHVFHFGFVIEQLAAAVVLPEGIAGEQDLFFRAVGDHGIRPVEHGNGLEGQGPFAQAYGIPFFHDLGLEDIPVMFLQFIGPLDRDQEGGIGAGLGQSRQAAGMVRFHMVHYNVVDFFRIHNGPDVAQLFPGEKSLHPVDQADFFIHDQEGVVGDPPRSGKAVEVMEGPVPDPHFVYIIDNGTSFHVESPFKNNSSFFALSLYYFLLSMTI